MPINTAELDDTQVEVAPPIEGRVNLNLTKVSSVSKGGPSRHTMFTLEFTAAGGDRIRQNLNWYGNPESEKQVTANRISFNQTVVPLAKLAKMDPETISKSAVGIGEFLAQVEGSLLVSAFVKYDDFGPKPGQFQAATEAA